MLGELGNKVLKNVDNGKCKDGVFKSTDATFKNIKPRVDTHWKKTDGPITIFPVSKPVTRSDSLKGLNNVGLKKQSKTTTSVVAAAQKKVVQVTKGTEVKKVKVVNLKREESRLTRRSLTKLKQLKKQTDSSSSTSSLTTNSDDDDEYKIEVG